MRIGNQIPGHFCSYDHNETATVKKHSGLRTVREGRGFSLDRSNLVGNTKPQYRVFYDTPLAYQNQWAVGPNNLIRYRLKFTCQQKLSPESTGSQNT
jgi:hypothetical protein